MHPIHVGIVGCGRIADLHAPGYENEPRARIYAVCDSNPETLERRRAEWKPERVYRDFHEMLADPRLDAVEILTPQALHESMVIAALRAGKHVAVQKPMTTDLASADRMLEAAAAAGRVYKITENYVFYPPLLLARKLIEDGELGDPLHVRIKYIGGASGGWDVPASAWQWRMAEAAAGRGPVTFDHGHHLWSTAWFLLGPIERLVAWIDSGDGILDTPANVLWKYASGARYGACDLNQSLELNLPSRYYSNDEWMEVTGSRGLLVIRRCTGLVRPGPPVSLFDGRGWRHFEGVPSDWLEGFKGATRNFLEAIRGEAPARLSGAEGREILRISLAIQRSARLRREVYVDELDRRWPGLHAWLRRRRERRAALASKQGAGGGWLGRLLGGGRHEALEPQAASLTERALESFDASAVPGWTSTIALHLTSSNPAHEARFTLEIQDGKPRLERGRLAPDAVLTVHVPAGLWAAILLGKKRIETAVLTGRFHIEGRAEEALKLRSALARTLR